MRRSLIHLLVLAATVSTVAACRSGETQPSDAHSDIVARFGVSEITVSDVDSRILALPPPQRPKPGEDLERWYTDQIHEMVIDRLLLAEAGTTHLEDDEAFRAARQEAEKQIDLQLCLAGRTPDTPPITEDDLRAAYDERSGELAAPERRYVFQIFLRRAPGARERIEALRDRVLAGESFMRLAEQYSESETRHRQGLVGWEVPGHLPSGFETVVFDLEEGVPSEPVVTRQGVHLFYVDQILPAKKLSFEEARSILRESLDSERQEAALTAIDAEIEPPPGSLVLDREAFVAAVQAGDADAPVLKLGDVSWTLADVRQRTRELVAREAKSEGVPTVELAWRLLDQARRREEIYQHCKTAGLVPEEAASRRLEAWRRRALVAAERHRRLVALASEDEDRLRLFYQSNIGDFSTSPTWTLRILRAPLGPRPMVEMARLEAAARHPGTGLDALRTELGGEIETLEPMSLPELVQRQPKLRKLIAPLQPGALTAPYRTARGLEIAEVEARTDAEPIPFDEVRERVAQRYVAQYTADLYERLSQRMLDEVDLEIDPEALATLKAAGLPQPDVSVDQLEELLDES